MKLVDILARELMIWPDVATHAYSYGRLARFCSDGKTIPDYMPISQEPEDHGCAFVTRAQWQEAREALISTAFESHPVGATHYIPGGFMVDSWWMREPGDNWYVWAEPSRQWALDTPSAGQKNLMKPIHESLQKKAWNGKGLPPTGIECDLMWDSEAKHYVLVKILAHDEGSAVFRFLTGDRKGEVGFDHQHHVNDLPVFRPTRTPEQIAAEEREKHISDICMIFDRDPNSPTNRNHAARLYDAGYRKVNDGNQKA